MEKERGKCIDSQKVNDEKGGKTVQLHGPFAATENKSLLFI